MKRRYVIPVVIGLVPIAIGGALMVSVGLGTDALLAFLGTRFKEMHATLKNADVVVDIAVDDEGRVVVSGFAPKTRRRAASVEGLLQILPANESTPKVVVIVSYLDGDAQAFAAPDPPQVVAALARIRALLAPRGIVLPPGGYTLRVQRKRTEPPNDQMQLTAPASRERRS
jgi:hypothetical protein